MQRDDHRHKAPPVAIFLHAGEYDRIHQGFSIAAAAVAEGRHVDLFFFWWALERMVMDKLDEPDFADRPEVAERFESKSIPNLRSLLGYLRESGQCGFYACSGSLAILGLKPELVEQSVGALVGWSGILHRTAGITDRFYL